MCSFGLSDLHGDGRVHDISGPDGISGFGFELTFRLRREVDETAPPTWPATLMQSLAKYVFQSGIYDHFKNTYSRCFPLTLAEENTFCICSIYKHKLSYNQALNQSNSKRYKRKPKCCTYKFMYSNFISYECIFLKKT